MLGKLLKYEFKSTSRVLWFLFAGLIIVSLLFGLVIRVNLNSDNLMINSSSITSNPGANVLMTVLITCLAIIYLLLIYAILITTTIVIVMRFYKNMLGGEGYLMHTLPVKTSSLIISKLITAFCWMLIAGLVIVISTIVLGLSSGIIGYALRNMDIKTIIEGIKYGLKMIGMNGWVMALLLIVSTLSTILMYYTSMAIGNLANNHKFLFSVLAYVGIQILISIILSATSITSSIQLANNDDIAWFMNYNLWIVIGTQLATGVGGFFLTNYLLSKKLNLA